MFGKRKKTLILKIFVVLLSFSMTTAGFSTNGGSARIFPLGKVLMIKEGQVVGEFSNEAPLPEGILLKCEQKCSVQLGDVYMVVEKDTVFSITRMTDHHELHIQEGTVYYSLSESSRPLHLKTPPGDATTGKLLLSETDLRGYVRVSENKTEIGVLEGGTMMVQTASGEMAIPPGNQITITALDPETSGAFAGKTGGFTRNQKIALGAVGAGIMTAGIFALASSSSGGGGSARGGGDDGSPAAP